MVLFYEWSSTVSKLEGHYEKIVYFLQTSSQVFLSSWLDRFLKNEMLWWPTQNICQRNSRSNLRRLWHIFYAQESRKLLKKNAIFGILKTISTEVWKPDSFLHLPISIPTFVAFIFVFENSSNIFSCSIPCGLLRSYFCGKCIHGVHPKSI